MTFTIVPTVLANSTDDFHRRLSRLLPVADELQVDIMDGKFVPSQSIAVHHIPDLHDWPTKRFEAHLMVYNPGAYIQPLARRGFSRVIFHIEAVSDTELRHLLVLCEKHKVRPVLAINPETPVACLLPYAEFHLHSRWL